MLCMEQNFLKQCQTAPALLLAHGKLYSMPPVEVDRINFDQAGHKDPLLLGLRAIHPHDGSLGETSIDIVTLHGLGTRSPRTWEAFETENATTENRRVINWLRDDNMLPSVINRARVMTFDWDSNFFSAAPVQSILGHADVLLQHLLQDRETNNLSQRPILFVASCFGGIILIEALNKASIHESPYRNILQFTAGIVFLATPFRGSRAAKDAKWRTVIGGIMGEDVNEELIDDLKGKTGLLRQAVESFEGIAHADWLRLPVHCFYETDKSEVLRAVLHRRFATLLSSRLTNKILVEKASACLGGYPRTRLAANHAMMSKYRGPEDQNFKLISSCLLQFANNARTVLVRRKEYGASKNVHWRVSRAANALFTGRSELVTRMVAALSPLEFSPSDQQKRFVLTGMGGIGKSEICLHVASRMRQDFWGVFLIDVAVPSQAIDSITSIAKSLGVPGNDITFEVAMTGLANIKEPWLLLLDNADDASFDYQVYFPTSAQTTILLTSRVPACAKYHTAGMESLQGLGIEHAVELLLGSALVQEKDKRKYEGTARTIAQKLSSHPLAVLQAGAYISSGRCTFDQYPDLLEQQRQKLLTFRPAQGASRYRDVYATFEISVSTFEKSEEQVAKDGLQLLGILSMASNNAVPFAVFEAAWGSAKILTLKHSPLDQIERNAMSDNFDSLELDLWHISKLPGFVDATRDEWTSDRLTEAVSLLMSLSLVTRLADNPDGLTMHPLVHAWARDRQADHSTTWVSTGSVLALAYLAKRDGDLLWRHVKEWIPPQIHPVLSYGPQSKILALLCVCGLVLDSVLEDVSVDRLVSQIFRALNLDPQAPSPDLWRLYYLRAIAWERAESFSLAVPLTENLVNMFDNPAARDDPTLLFLQYRLSLTYKLSGQPKQLRNLIEQIAEVERVYPMHSIVLQAIKHDRARMKAISQHTIHMTGMLGRFLEIVMLFRSQRLSDTARTELARVALRLINQLENILFRLDADPSKLTEQATQALEKWTREYSSTDAGIGASPTLPRSGSERLAHSIATARNIRLVHDILSRGVEACLGSIAKGPLSNQMMNSMLEGTWLWINLYRGVLDDAIQKVTEMDLDDGPPADNPS